jgi:molybdopterin synthase catalytic subunit
VPRRARGPAARSAAVAHAGAGALASFVGVVRDVNEGAAVAGIEYEAYTPMAERELAEIVAEAGAAWPGSEWPSGTERATWPLGK